MKARPAEGEEVSTAGAKPVPLETRGEGKGGGGLRSLPLDGMGSSSAAVTSATHEGEGKRAEEEEEEAAAAVEGGGRAGPPEPPLPFTTCRFFSPLQPVRLVGLSARSRRNKPTFRGGSPRAPSQANPSVCRRKRFQSTLRATRRNSSTAASLCEYFGDPVLPSIYLRAVENRRRIVAVDSFVVLCRRTSAWPATVRA